MSGLIQLHKVLNQTLKNGEVNTYEEVIIEGKDGIKIHYFNKDSKNTEKITIKTVKGKVDEFEMVTQDGDKKDKKIISKQELLDEIKKNKKLKFASDFAKTQKGGAWLEKMLSRPKKASSNTKPKKASSNTKPKKASSSKKPKKAKTASKGKSSTSVSAKKPKKVSK